MPTSTDEAARQALAVAHALRDPERVTASLTPQAAATLCDGLAGTALLHACLARADPQFATAAAQHWEAAARLGRNTPPDGIHTGPGALAASLIIGTAYLPDPGSYADTTRNATAWLSARAEGLALHQQRRTAQGRPGAPWAVYDAIKGLAGIGRVLLAAHATGHRKQAQPGLTATLTTLTAILRTRHGQLPGWWLPAEDHPSGVTVHASGAATTGLSHGAAGPLALLAIAYTAGRTVPGQAEAIRTTATWLTTHRDADGSWPPHISGDTLDHPPTPVAPRSPGRRDAWCYGTPGIGRALTLAGHALTDPTLTTAGRTAIDRLAERRPTAWDTEGPTLCHGTAGTLQAATRTGHPAVAAQAAEHITALHDPDRPFGFPHIEAGVRFDNPGFLTGAGGVALALADHTGLLSDPTTAWDSLLLLS
ncbi:lanthionine synthetase C family protein [Streptomyces sp. ACA25]|uniref:lanthionine synthetase C family protein n=1 Tax=Streptomyces sp. ACA25 TaxID=3022596 RepID=UPI002307EABD|nr:lanthionine synthetase C family protein [Streptomyces sp. ACA25]MDB1086180.1 lanthionine synthetase C family protein [Streptomyces sp. ACA25]